MKKELLKLQSRNRDIQDRLREIYTKLENEKRELTDVLIVDASKGFEKVGKNNKLRASDIKKITDAVKQGFFLVQSTIKNAVNTFRHELCSI